MKKIILALALGILAVPAHAQYENTFLGALTGTYITTGSYNAYMGWNVGIFNKAGSNNTAIGHQSLFGNGGVYRADYNTAVGGQTGANIKNGADYNTMLGYRAGYTLTVGTNNVLIGQNAVTPSSTTSNYMNIAGLIRGDLKLSSVTVRGNLYANKYYGDGSSLTGIATGMPDVVYSTGGTMSGMLVNNKGINAHHYEIGGSTVLYVSPSGGGVVRNTMVGTEAGAITGASNNTFLGYQAGYANIAGTLNTFLGTQAGFSSTGNNSTYIGGYTATSATGGGNIVIGANAGPSLIGGTNNILIGDATANVPTPGTNRYLNIGNTILSDMDTSSITLKGDVWADAYYGDGSGLTGVVTTETDPVYSASVSTIAKTNAPNTFTSSQTFTSTFTYTDGNQGSGKVLTSDAGGNATWQAPTGGAIPVMTLTAMEAYASASAGLPLIVSDASAPYSMCMSTGTDAGASVLLNTTIHCQ